MQDEDPKFLCVGGPLHGKRRKVYGTRLTMTTTGMRSRDAWIRHSYDLRLGPRGFFWRWRMVPSWPRSGFVKPKY